MAVETGRRTAAAMASRKPLCGALDATRGQRRKGGRTAQCYFRSRRRSEGKVRVVFVYRNLSSLRNDCRRNGDVWSPTFKYSMFAFVLSQCLRMNLEQAAVCLW